MSKIITIHQPDFMPWLGFFDKISNADIWVILDHVENNPRDAAFWGRRVKMLINNKPMWVSVPLEKPITKNKIGLPINQMKIKTSESKNLEKTLKSINQSYKKHPYFDSVFPLIKNYFKDTDNSLANKNMSFIKTVLNYLKIEKEIIYSSSLNCKKKSTELLIEIIMKLKGKIYLAGGGADGYMQNNNFKKNNIELKFNNFQHPVYKQKNINHFIPGLSIIDVLMNIGYDQTKTLLKKQNNVK